MGEQGSCSLNWNGQSTLAPSSSAVILQIYNHDSGEWENVDTEDAEDASVDFSLGGTIPDLTNYKDAGNVISCRIYQLAI